MAASECLLQDDGKFAGVTIDQVDFAPGIKVNNFSMWRSSFSV